MRHANEKLIPRGERELLAERLESKQHLADLFGITMRYYIRDLHNVTQPVIAEHQPDTQMYAASLNKLLIARAAVHRLTGYDQSVQRELRGMLRDSDNEAAAALIARLGPEVINGFAGAAAPNTALHIRPDGSAHLGVTTPKDALELLLSLETPYLVQPTELETAAAESLRHSATRYGVRPRVYRRGGTGEGVELVNKTGQINADSELKEQYGQDLYRHDTGDLRHGERRIGYAIMTAGDASSRAGKKLQAWLANSIIGQIGEYMLESIEPSENRTAVRKGIALQAIFSSGK